MCFKIGMYSYIICESLLNYNKFLLEKINRLYIIYYLLHDSTDFIFILVFYTLNDMILLTH